jgi:hypothetical protein
MRQREPARTRKIVVIHIYWLSASAPLSRVPHHPVSSRIVVVAMQQA